MEEGLQITAKRLAIWKQYHEGLADLEKQGHLQRMYIPESCKANAHIYYFLTHAEDVRAALWSYLKEAGIQTTTHYVPLHSAPQEVNTDVWQVQ